MSADKSVSKITSRAILLVVFILGVMAVASLLASENYFTEQPFAIIGLVAGGITYVIISQLRK